MRKKLVNSQLTNYTTYMMYLRQFVSLAENVFTFKNLPKFIDKAFLNSTLLRKGAIAFFYEEELESLVALPFIPIGKPDIYGRPVAIQAISQNGYSRILKNKDFVIMYDNNGRYPIFVDVLQYAERVALDTRVTDINISQQKTPRIFKVTNGNEKTLQDAIAKIDGFEEAVVSYNNLIEDVDVVLSPAPYVADKLDIHKQNDYAEFLRLIGVANMQYTKRERNIKDEITAMQGGTIASRFSRFEPRKDAVEEINEKFKDYLKKPISVEYYDGLPTTLQETNLLDLDNENIENEEVSE